MRFWPESIVKGHWAPAARDAPNLTCSTSIPNLLDLYELSPPFQYQPGDATVHHPYMVHGAPPNDTARPRWTYLCTYTPVDVRYWHGSTEKNWGSERIPLSDPRHPLILERPAVARRRRPEAEWRAAGD
jgi:hypothetical protein